jgi:hypothetical protein
VCTLREIETHNLISSGIYKHLRHTRYSGTILIFIVVSVATSNFNTVKELKNVTKWIFTWLHFLLRYLITKSIKMLTFKSLSVYRLMFFIRIMVLPFFSYLSLIITEYNSRWKNSYFLDRVEINVSNPIRLFKSKIHFIGDINVQILFSIIIIIFLIWFIIVSA